MSSYFQTLPELIDYIGKNFNNPAQLRYKTTSGFKDISTQEFTTNIERVALALIKLQVKPGDKIGIMATPSPFWVMMDQAILNAGAVTVPMFANISQENLKYEIEESEMKCIVIDSQEQYHIIGAFKDDFDHIFSLADHQSIGTTITWQKLIDLGYSEAADYSNELKERKGNITPDTVATIIYTSGTSGVPKGVEITHGNLVSQIEGAGQFFPIDNATDSALSCLPLAHVFERMVTMYYFSTGMSVSFARDVKEVGDDLKVLHPTVITLVPRLLEKVFAKMKANVEAATGLKAKLAGGAFERALVRDPFSKKSFMDKLYDKLVYSKMREGMGGNLRLAISGSAPLSPDLYRFFLNIGVPIFEGYGCTETSPVISANYPDNVQIGSVGKVFPGVEVQIASDGEILSKGPHVMKGYYKKPEETAESIKDGWYATGDLGAIDSMGFLKITGRKKELYKTVNGKYVAPVPIEAKIGNLSKIIDMAMVVADKRKYTTALLFPDWENMKTIKEDHQMGHLDDQQFLQEEMITGIVQKTIDEVNESLNHWEQVQKFKIIETPIGIESGELTPTMKIKRNVIEERFSAEIEAMYDEP